MHHFFFKRKLNYYSNKHTYFFVVVIDWFSEFRIQSIFIPYCVANWIFIYFFLRIGNFQFPYWIFIQFLLQRQPNQTKINPFLFNRLEISFEKNVEILLKKRGNSFLNEKKHNTSIQFGNVYLFCCLFVWFGVSGNRIEFIIHSKIFESLITHSLCVFWMFFQSKKITKICFSVQKNKNIEVTRKKGKSKVCNL